MKKMLQLEELAQLALAVTFLGFLPVQLPWWVWLLLAFAPDVSMVGYGVNNRVGAMLYNGAHHKGVAALVLIAGLLLGNVPLQVGGLVLWGHSSLDRVLGYGLKYPSHFTHTHLGWMGKQRAVADAAGQ
jgi:hypothetical protein